ncbi:fibrillin-2-like isoform X2 [Ruditapes philippinarum]|uniref:fibrillin-2-like isoform X2 n=1 Tax=Ruditapes philippinarum TaxID=129788 RepID=UPI00295AC8A9|nr:fibrillin-2-like isoform X2 [Ruditapes philippinarum]
MFTLLDARKSVALTKSDVSGIVFKQLYHYENIRQNNAVNCINWYNENKDQKRYFDYIASLTPECPCDIRLSRFDPWFWQIGLQRNRKDKSHYCVDMLHRGNFGHFGKSCCYDLQTWLWVYQRPIAGGFQLYHPKIQKEHLKHDHEPKENCCMKSNYCNLYYSLRPTGSCYRISPYRFGTFWGDPHFATLDGLNFTFNGIGEFVLLHVSTENITFDLQARTDRTLKKDGNLTDATAFTAFAARDNTNASVHVELNKARNGLIISANQVDITNQYNAGSNKDLDDPFTYSTPEANLILARRDNALSVLFPSSGISLNISVSVQMLSISTIIPNALNNVTSGLLGNFDGNPYNDLMMPNGTVINANSSERHIFDYGKTWEIDGKKSVFVYEDGKSHEDYQNNSFTPRFLDEVDVDKRAQAEQDCNGAENIECVFDLVFTENKEVANATRILKTEADQDRHEINEIQPTLTVCELVNATLGKKVTCQLSFEDGHDIYFIANNANAQINKTLSTVEYMQSNTHPVNIQLAVNNSNNRSSTVMVINVLLCTGCSGHGVCSNVTRDDQQQTEYFKYSECICESPYDGPDCENEIDWCSTNPCSLERECITLSASEQLSKGKSYTCADCPEGYVKDMEDSDIDECIDVDECSEKTTECEHICVNTEGSFECSCYTGYRVSTRNTSKCNDVNECEEALDNCSHLCVNNPGGFSCQCHDGYKLQDDGSTCTADRGVCNNSSESKCANTGGCTLEANGIAKCFCDRGLELDANGVACNDIDECAQNVCPQLCTNNHGNFTCSCFTGYYLNGLTNCEACAATRWGENCEKECVCTGRGAQICDPVKGCLCDPGWEGDTCDEDINECDVANICKDPMKECTNNLGSYLCQCMNGFQEINGTCEDINECASPILHDCMQECNNAFGGYTCGCFEGYVEINETSCADIDECEQGTADCEQNCINEPGFYNCYCNTGYILNDDRSSCEKVSDPCLQLQNLNCSHHCIALDVGYACGCRKGFQILSDKETCSDVNECTDADLNLCDKVATCRNTYGSFTCECPTGTKLANDKRTCLVCDDFHFGKECSQTCSCLHGVCDKKTGCVCDSGWIGNNCNIDVDECTAGLLRCSAANTRCVNTAGGAICTCNAGYMNISNQCIDVDECKDSAMNTCDQVCINNNGSYTCKCQQGFTMFEGSCQDIDECSGINDCDQICDNTIGSYRCSCHDGYALNLTERKSCSPVHVCTEDKSLTCGDNALCMMQGGEIECRCNKGYVKKNDICVDINECSETPCSHNCINTNGSYTCNCQIGYFLKEDKVTCQVCDLFKYGTNCEDICTCVEENTDSCDPKTGQCYCKNGWTGDECDDDADECMNNDDVCPFNSECYNTPGSFNCKCNIGYLQVASGECKVCDNRNYGENCNSICNCHIENTDSCNHTSGACICKEGWAGETCLDDINECKSDPDPCIDVSHSICENRNGSYECICTTGFRGFENLCSDINECKEDAFNACEQSCINSIGSFHCGCFNGYFMVNNVCKECSGNTFGDNCTEQCDCVATNTEHVQQMCDTVTGNCRCKSNWKGETCAEDVDECEDTTLCNDKNNTMCVNTLGWYQCICIKGFQENADGHCVAECPRNTYGENCTEQCNCLSINAENEEQTCDTVTGKCICKSNWKGDTCVEDVNECEEDPTLCSDKNNTTCVNTQGWYQCDCIKGFNVNADGQCVAECPSNTFGENCTEQCNCLAINAENEEQTCDTVTGKCRCKPNWKGETCAEDVNECDEDQTLCSDKNNTTCVNTHGWYQCDCIKGFKENADGQCVAECPRNTFGENCTEQCNCLQINAENEEQTCDTVTGKCICKSNWKGETCAEDVDECEEDQTLCSDRNNTTCVNTHGWYQCDCIKGFKENADGQCVAECPSNTFGENCTEQCNCLAINAENTEQTCDTVTGKCRCKPNWKGDTCAEDVNECEEDMTLCNDKNNTTCVNTNGWYQCDCINGFKENADGHCVAECFNNTFGENCTKRCDCVATNAENVKQMCDTVTGKCRCKSNWKGDTCAEDVDECEEDTILCSNKNNTTCVNTHGWYQCDCIRGFKENTDGQCVRDSSSSTDIPKVAGVMTFNFSITIHTNSLAGNNLKSANSFDIARGKVEKSLLGFYSRYTAAVIQIFIVDLKIGSIIVDYVVAFDENYSVSSELIRATAGLIQGTQIMFDGEMTNATSDWHQNIDQCTLYLILIGSCDDGYHCEVSNNIPLCRQSKEDGGLFHVIIVIVSTLGGLLLIIGAIIVVICLRKWKQNQKKHGKQRKYFADNMKQKNYEGGNYQRSAKSTKEDLSEGSLNSKFLALNQKQSGFNDLAGRDVAYNQPLHIPRAHIERSSFGTNNSFSDSGGTRENRARNDNGLFNSGYDVTADRSNRARNDHGNHNDGFESDGLRVNITSANDVINKGFNDIGSRSNRPTYDDRVNREEYFNY